MTVPIASFLGDADNAESPLFSPRPIGPTGPIGPISFGYGGANKRVIQHENEIERSTKDTQEAEENAIEVARRPIGEWNGSAIRTGGLHASRSSGFSSR
jgi:hypothetical protein